MLTCIGGFHGEANERPRTVLTCRESLDTTECRTLEPENIERTENLCREFMVALDQTLTAERRTQGEGWLLGGHPPIIDAHAVPMIRRLMDRERTELVPSAVLAYAKRVMESAEWDRTVHGRAVTYDRSYGPAKDLNPM